MARPKWYPDEKTIRWVVKIAERHARRARALASDDARRRLYHGAIEQDARASAFDDLVLTLVGPRVPEPEDDDVRTDTSPTCTEAHA